MDNQTGNQSPPARQGADTVAAIRFFKPLYLAKPAPNGENAEYPLFAGPNRRARIFMDRAEAASVAKNTAGQVLCWTLPGLSPQYYVQYPDACVECASFANEGHEIGCPNWL